jgi:hypothetical protein
MPVTLAFARMLKHHRNGREDIPYSEYRQEMQDAGVPLNGKNCTMRKLVSHGLAEFVTNEGIIRAGTTREVHIELLKYNGEIVPLEKDAEIPAEVYAVRLTDKQRIAMCLPKRRELLAQVETEIPPAPRPLWYERMYQKAKDLIGNIYIS